MGVAPANLPLTGTWVGQRIGDYLLEAAIGEGGMGAVYYAAKVGDRGPCFHRAVKVPRGTALLDAGQLARFRREADVHHLVSGHKNILPLHEVGSHVTGDCEVPYMVLDYVEGATLAQVVRAAAANPKILPGGLIPVNACVHLAIQVLSALAHAHDLGVLHKDVDPSNVMLGCDGGARLFDWGIAGGDDFEKLTRTGQVVGKFGYMAPELVRGEQHGADTDLFGIGLVLYEMLTLSKAFPIDDKPIIQVIQEVASRRLPALWRDVPLALVAALTALTHSDRRLRPRSAAQAIDLLDAAVAGHGLSAAAEADLRTLACAFAPPENLRTGRYAIYLPPLTWKSVSEAAVVDQSTAIALDDNRDGVPIAICDRKTEIAADDSVPVVITDRPTAIAVDEIRQKVRRAMVPTLPMMPIFRPPARTAPGMLVLAAACLLALLVALFFAAKEFWR